jgi:hypothetical protein
MQRSKHLVVVTISESRNKVFKRAICEVVVAVVVIMLSAAVPINLCVTAARSEEAYELALLLVKWPCVRA